MKFFIIALTTLGIFGSFLFTGTSDFSTGFVTEPVSPEEQERFWDNTNLVRVEESGEFLSIECIDINEDGMIALGLHNRTINIYDSQCQYLYGFTLVDNGMYAVKWDGPNLLICSVRSRLIISVDSHGNCVGMERIVDDTWEQQEQNRLNWLVLRWSNKTENGDRYFIAPDSKVPQSAGFSYLQAIRVDKDGNRIVFYDASVLMIIALVLIAAIIVTAVTTLIVKLICKPKYTI